MNDPRTNKLLFFLIILGVIAWGVLQKKQNEQVLSRDNQRKADLTRAVSSLEEYKKVHGYYPDSLDSVGNFQDPVSVLSYTYITNKSKTKFKVLTVLENRKDMGWMDLEEECGAVPCSWGLSVGLKITEKFEENH